MISETSKYIINILYKLEQAMEKNIKKNNSK